MKTNKILGYELDKYQKEVVKENEKNVLLLAGAGSGKTLTIIAKIRYLIKEKNYKESEILCLSLTNEAVNSLKAKLKENYNYNIDVLTFHKLCINIIKQNKEIKICNENLLEYIAKEYINHIALNYPKMLKNILNIYNKKIIIDPLKSYKKLLQYKKKELNKFIDLIIKFINLYKVNNNNYQFINQLYNKENAKNKKILLIIYKILKLYEEEKASSGYLDLNDVLFEVIKYIKNTNLNYKYIIVDEYQDTSYSKYKIIKELMIITSAKLLAVGDDYQSIFAFTGCNLNLFLDFKNCFSNTKIMNIKNIYRNSKELTFVAQKFITKNKNQMKKELISNKSIKKPIKIIYVNNINKSLDIIINKIKKDIMILGRNNSDFKNIEKRNGIKYLTVHKAKGLECENVILINNRNDLLGFPNKLKNEHLIDELLTKNKYLYEEERRLFYVALTRTKKNIYLLVKKNNESIFIKELLKDYKKYVEQVSLQNLKKDI